MDNKIIFFLIALLMVVGGCSPAIKHIPLTSGGRHVILVGHELPLLIPNRPLDRCTVLNQLTIESKDDYSSYSTLDWDNALRNRTAEIFGNVAIRILYESEFMMTSPSVLYGVQGMALQCPEDILKAAGFVRDGYSEVEGVDISGRNRFSSNTDEESSASTPRGARNRLH